MLGAKDRYRQYWGKTGNTCGVRIQALHGHWDEHYLVGDMAEVSPQAPESEAPSDGRSGAASDSKPRTTH